MCGFFKNTLFLKVVVLFCAACPFAQSAASDKKEESIAVRSGDDAKKLITTLTGKLKNASKRQISRLEQGSGEKFKVSKRLVQQQQEARDLIVNKVTPAITRKVETMVDGDKPARMKVVDAEKIAKLSAEQLSKLLENLASGLRMLPPLPDQVGAWAKVIAPLLSFDEKTKAMMSKMVGQWFDVLLENEADLEKLARISSDDKAQQQARIAELRGKYKEYYHNASQLLYPWVQIALLLNARDPLSTWLQYATNNHQQLRAKFKKLVSVAQNALEKAGKDESSEADARGFILLAIASLFAPDELFKQLGGKIAEAEDND